MKFGWKHVLTLLASVAAPAAFTVLAHEPLSWSSVGHAAAAFGTTLVAVFLNSPIVDPGVQK